MSSSRVAIARFFEREPMTVGYPMLANRAARPLPAGPVPPKMPMRMATAWHIAASKLQGADGMIYGPGMGLLDGKKIVITGVLTDASLAYGVARLARAEGAEIVLTGAGRAMSLTQRTARKLGEDIDVYELDVTVPEHGLAVRETLAEKWGHVDGVVHSIGFAPAVCLGDDFLAAQWEDVAIAMHVSAYSLKALADAFLPLMSAGGSFVGFDFDNRQAWPAYNWMGVAKSALQSVSRYLAKEVGPLGIRSNLVAAGPIKSMAAKSIPGFALFEDTWDVRAPLGWDVTNSEPVAKACIALLSDWFPATTGEIVHVDGGYHAIGA
jgi:enoyl-[acyl-carrier protein] reductase I